MKSGAVGGCEIAILFAVPVAVVLAAVQVVLLLVESSNCCYEAVGGTNAEEVADRGWLGLCCYC